MAPARWLSQALLALALSLCALPAAMAQNDSGDPGEQVRLSLERYAKLLATAQRQGGPRATWSPGSVSVSLPQEGKRFARVVVQSQLKVVGEGEAIVPLLPNEVVLQSATFNGSQAALTQSSGTHALLLGKDRREGLVRLEYLVAVGPDDAGGRSTLVPVPPLPGASLTVDGPGASEAEAWPAAEIRRSGNLQGRIPGVSAVALRWGMGSKGHDVRQANYALTPDASGGGMDVSAELTVVLEARRAKVRVAPASVALMSITDNNRPVPVVVIDGWHTARLQGKGNHTLTAQFRLPIDRTQGQPQVSLGLTRVPITRVEVKVPGKRSIEFAPEVPALTTTVGKGDNIQTLAVAHLPPSNDLRVKWTESRAAPESTVRVNTETFQLLTLQEGVLRSRVVMQYEVIRGRLKEIPVEIPNGVVVYKVTGEGIEDWLPFPKTEDEPRQVRITLGRELQGKTTIEMILEQKVPLTEGAALNLPLVKPMKVFREMGVVALFDGEKVGFAPAKADAFTKVGQDALPTSIRQTLKDKVNQAYKHIGPPGSITSAVAPAKARKARFDAVVQSLYTIKEGALAANAVITMNVKSGRKDTLIFSIPEGVTEPQVNAPKQNKVEQKKDFDAGPGRKAYELRFTQALKGEITIIVDFEQLLPKELGKIALPDVRVHEAEVESGQLAVTADTEIEITPLENKDLRRIDITELPRSLLKRTEQDLRLGYQYTLGPWGLTLEVKRNETVQTLEAVVSRAWLDTHVLESGYIVSRATYEVVNQDRQYLRVNLPEGAKVLGVSVGARQVKAVTDENQAIAVPLLRRRAALVDIAYQIKADPLGSFTSLDLLSPRLDLRMSDLQWRVRTPWDLGVLSTDTDLEQLGSGQWSGVDRAEGDALAAIQMPNQRSARTQVFAYAVHDANSPALEVSFFMARTLGSGTADILGILGLLALIWVIRLRRNNAQLGGLGWTLVVFGLGAIVLRTVFWGMNVPEGLLALAVLVAAAAWPRKLPKSAPADDGASA
ncbi:MAG: hypothetical protein ACE366_00230 [Bradymonadia bacterium]